MKIWTDGSVYPNPNGTGGWAFVIDLGGFLIGRAGFFYPATNNSAELTAILQVFLLIRKYSNIAQLFSSAYPEAALPAANPLNKPIDIFSDSQYCINSVTVWAKNRNWEHAFPNKELIKQIYDLINSNLNQIRFHFVRGHNGDYHNELCDKYAGLARTKKINFDFNHETIIHTT
jgi:ribonuclease HI